MANWYYYDKNGEKIGPITTSALKAIAAQGHITPETVIENRNGRSVVAGTVNGLTFPKPAPHITNGIYGLTPPPLPQPPVGPNPFSAAPPQGANPFTVPVPKVKQTTPQNVVVPVPLSVSPVKKNRPSFWISIVGVLLLASVAGIAGKILYTATRQ